MNSFYSSFQKEVVVIQNGILKKKSFVQGVNNNGDVEIKGHLNGTPIHMKGKKNVRFTLKNNNNKRNFRKTPYPRKTPKKKKKNKNNNVKKGSKKK